MSTEVDTQAVCIQSITHRLQAHLSMFSGGMLKKCIVIGTYLQEAKIAETTSRLLAALTWIGGKRIAETTHYV